MISSSKREFLEFAKEHGGHDSCVEVHPGYYLFPDGAFLTLRNNNFDLASWGIPEPNQYWSAHKNQQIERERLKNVVLYHQTRYVRAAGMFDKLKTELASKSRERQDPDDLKHLKALADDVRQLKKKYKTVERDFVESDPRYQTPEQQAAEAMAEDRIAARADAFNKKLQSINI